MRMSVKVSAALLFLGLTVLQTVPVLAAEESYTYTVRFFSGAQGSIGGKDVVIHNDLQYGERVTFNQRDVVLNDNSKYYIKGIRESGKDNNTVNSVSSFQATSDKDYVVVYGILGDAVAYTVNYVDENGNELRPSETYYGNVGDEPVIAYLYIEGYQPQAYNLTGTLKANAAENVFNFVYTPLDSGTQQPAAEPTATAAPATSTMSPTSPAAVPGIQGTTAPAAVTQAPGTTADEEEDAEDQEEDADEEAGADAEGGDEAGEAGAEGGDEEESGEPSELQRIDDEEVPLADMDGGDSALTGLGNDFAKRIGGLPMAGKIAICSGIVLFLGVAGWFLLARDRKRVKEIER